MNKSFQSLEDLNNSKNPCHFLFGLMIFDFLQNKIQYPQFHLPKYAFLVVLPMMMWLLKFFLGYQTLVADFD